MVSAFVLCLFALSVSALYTADGPVTLLTKENFGQTVLLSEKPWAVEFFAPCMLFPL